MKQIHSTTTLILFRGSEQQGWFPSANHSLPITEELSGLQISSSKFPGLTTTVSYSPEIFEVSQRALECISNALALEEGDAMGIVSVKIGQMSTLIAQRVRESTVFGRPN